MTRDVEVSGPLRVNWMAPDGHGGAYIHSNRQLYRVNPNGEMLPLPIPLPSASDSIPLPNTQLSVSPDGYLWRLEFPHLFRLTESGAWDEIRIAKPDAKEYACRIKASDSTHLAIRCTATESLDVASSAFGAKVEWPRISDWAPYADSAGNPEGSLGVGQASPWTDADKLTRQEMQLVLEHDHPSNWRNSIWTFTNPDSWKGKDTIPFPARWTGPRGINGPGDFTSMVPLMARSGGNVWIALDQMIAVRSDSSWTMIYASAPDRNDQTRISQTTPSKTQRGPGKNPHPLVRAVPYLATTYLAYSAIESGPGWASEAAWAYGGTMAGMFGGVVGLSMVLAPCWNGSCPEEALPYVISLLATVPLMGAAWAVQSHDTRTDRSWQRFGGAMLGAATGVGVFFVDPDSRHAFLLGTVSLGLGAVVGYRFAWY